MKLTQSILLALVLLLSACGGQPSAATAVEDYLQAIVERNVERASTLSCAGWESQARTELESFSAVTVTIENPACQESGIDGELTLVSCTGKIVANYGNEVLEIDLADRTYLSANEGGEWRMCGYR